MRTYREWIQINRANIPLMGEGKGVFYFKVPKSVLYEIYARPGDFFWCKLIENGFEFRKGIDPMWKY
jgi:hypothetical protein